MGQDILNIIKTSIEVNGKKYTLQHPGNREWMKLKKTLFKLSSDEIDMIPLLDYFFEFCLFPAEGAKPTLDSVPLKELEEVWSVIAPKFLGGSLESGYRYPNKGK